MYILGLQFENYRNLVNNYIEPCKTVNVIYGDNAQGKTNLLEAIWLFCGGHSFRGAKENELINFDKSYTQINLKFFGENREQTAKIKYSSGKKEVYINDIYKNSSSYLAEKITAVVFSPEHLNLVKSGPSKRRRFLDTAICQQKIKYAVTLSRYNRIVNQRNALLKDIRNHPELKDTLQIWDDNLSIFGAMIIKERLNYINRINESAKKYHFGISENSEKLDISYLSSFDVSSENDTEEITYKFSQALKKKRQEDLFTGYTNAGPHRDDFDIEINGIKAKTYGSQGQQRSAVLSLKLAEAEILAEINDEKPVILLDDVLSELDGKRQDYLLNRVDGYQVFITCCEKSNKEQLKKGKIFYIEKGNILSTN